MPTKDEQKVISTKVPSDIAEAINIFCAERGITPYEAGKLVWHTLVCSMDKFHNISPAMRRIIDIFETMPSWRDAITHAMTDDDVIREVGEAIYFLQDANGNKHGCLSVMVSKPFFDKPQYTMNIPVIFEKAVCRLDPSLYRRMRFHAIEEGAPNLLELVREWEREQRDALDKRTIDEEFADNERAENNKRMAAAPFVRKHHKGIDETPVQQQIDFEDSDAEA